LNRLGLLTRSLLPTVKM
jgi:hypothetical protein